MKIRRGDQVQILVGRDRARRGQVSRVFPKDGTVLVLGLNQYKRHRKMQKEGQPGEVVTLDRPLAISKLAVVCPKCRQPTRVGFRLVGVKKERVCRKCGNAIDQVKEPKLSKSKSKPNK